MGLSREEFKLVVGTAIGVVLAGTALGGGARPVLVLPLVARGQVQVAAEEALAIEVAFEATEVRAVDAKDV